MGCYASTEAAGVVPSPRPSGSKVAPDVRKDGKPSLHSGDACYLPMQLPLEAPPELGSDDLPGWRIVCRLSPQDVRAKWGTRPRPSQGVTCRSMQLQVQLEPDGPSTLPLQLVPSWLPQVGTSVAGYTVQRELARRPWAQVLEVHSAEGQHAMEVHHIFSEAEVTKFLRRLQIEAKENQHFLRFRDAVLSLPGQLGIVEEMHQVSLWKDLERCDDAALARAACALRCGLSGLARLHSLGWLLCVSHENLCLTYDGVWKLCGLHLARPTHQVEVDREKLGRHLLPEVLFELPLSEKLDIWLLGWSISEALLQERLSGPRSQSRVTQLRSLADFIGSLPENLVLRHPRREELFMPEGQLLRRAGAGAELEAIEPVGGLFRGHHGLRPKRIFEALKKLPAHQMILGALDLLLQVDPQERPSAAEASKSGAVRRLDGLEVETPSPSSGKIRVAHEDVLDEPPSSQRGSRGSGGQGPSAKHVFAADLPLSDEEDEQVQSAPAQASSQRHVGFGQDVKEPSPSQSRHKASRKGFVSPHDLPPSDEEDDEAQRASSSRHVGFDKDVPEASPSQKRHSAARKGTGFVSPADLPLSDDEDEQVQSAPAQASSQRHVGFGEDMKEPSPSQSRHKASRKGTGFVSPHDLPPSDEEDDEAQRASSSRHVGFDKDVPEASPSQKRHSAARKGTGFVAPADLPLSDEEDVEQVQSAPAQAPSQRHVGFGQDVKEPSPSQSRHKASRKGTGFVSPDDLPHSDEEDDEAQRASSSRHVGFDKDVPEASPSQKRHSAARKGTAFVAPADLPLSDDEDEQVQSAPAQASSQRHVGFDKDADASPSGKTQSASRKGTGFVSPDDLPHSDEEEDEVQLLPNAWEDKRDKSTGRGLLSRDDRNESQEELR